MSISDDLMWRYHTLCTDLTEAEIVALRGRVDDGSAHPRDVKADLARAIVTDFCGAAAAAAAEDEFRRVFAEGQTPDKVPEVLLDAAPGAAGSVTLLLAKLLAEHGLAASRTAARRLLAQGAVRLDGERIGDERLDLPADRLRDGVLLRVGKRRFLRVKSR